MAKSIEKIVLLILLAFILNGCATTQETSAIKGSYGNPLRIGVTPDYPPIIFKLKDEIKGAEADFALLLARALGRDARFVELDWDRQISALMEGKIDVIMSGMTITEARKARIEFTAPYLKSSLAVLMHAENASKFDSLKAIQESFSTVGVIKDTTGEAYVRRNFPNVASIISIPKASDVPYLLKNRRIDLFVHDAPSIVWLVSENEGTLKGFWEPLNEEYLGWGVRRDDQELLMKVNSVLASWKKDGTLKAILTRWLPYWKKFD